MREKPYTEKDIEAMEFERNLIPKKKAEIQAHAEDDERKIIEGINLTPEQEGEKKGDAALKEGVLGEITSELEGKDIDRDDPEVQRMAREMSFDELNARLEAEMQHIDLGDPRKVKSPHLRRESQLKDAIHLKLENEGKIPRPK